MSLIGETVRRLRAAAGLAQQSLAVAAGPSLSAATQIEQGTDTDPRTSTARALAKALGVTADALVNPPDMSSGPPAPRRRKRKGG